MWIETEWLYIRELAEGDFDLMTSVWRERFPPLLIEDKAESGSFLQDLWEDNRTSDILTGLIFLREGNVFCGRVNIQNVEAEIPGSIFCGTTKTTVMVQRQSPVL